MSSDVNKSGYEVGCEYAEKLKRYIDSVGELPTRNGTANKAAIARAAGIPRESLYNNPMCEDILESAIGMKGLAKQPDDERAKLERRITSLEQNNASLVAEVYELRRQLEQLRHVEAILEEGRRVVL